MTYWFPDFFFLFFFYERGRQTQEKKAEVHVYFLEHIPLKKMICPSLIPQPVPNGYSNQAINWFLYNCVDGLLMMSQRAVRAR